MLIMDAFTYIRSYIFYRVNTSCITIILITAYGLYMFEVFD